MSTPPAWSYSGDPSSSDKDEVRFLIQDVDPTTPMLSDAEIQYLIDTWGPRFNSNTLTASVAASVISRKFAGLIPISSDQVSAQLDELAKNYSQMAVQLRQEFEEGADAEAEIDLSSIEFPLAPDFAIMPLNFAIGMHDNPAAGQQAYGGYYPLPAIDWAEHA